MLINWNQCPKNLSFHFCIDSLCRKSDDISNREKSGWFGILRHSPQLSPCLLPIFIPLPISSTSPFPTFPPLSAWCGSNLGPSYHFSYTAYIIMHHLHIVMISWVTQSLLALLLEFLVNLLLYNTPSDPRLLCANTADAVRPFLVSL